MSHEPMSHGSGGVTVQPMGIGLAMCANVDIIHVYITDSLPST